MQFQRMFLKKKTETLLERIGREKIKKEVQNEYDTQRTILRERTEKNEKKEVPTMWYTYGIVLGSVIALVVRKPRVLC